MCYSWSFLVLIDLNFIYLFRNIKYGQRSVDRRPTRRSAELVKVVGSRWMRAAQDQLLWRTLWEIYVNTAVAIN